MRLKGDQGGGALLLAGLAVAGFCALLVTVPRLFPTDPSVLSVASAQGYNTAVAFRTAAVWSILIVVAAALLLGGRRWVSPTEPSETAGTDQKMREGRATQTRAFALTLALVVGAIIIGYFPPFLARSGPFQEDAVFINLLHRMHGGMQPYRDFEFLYGPMMIAPIAWLTRLTGFSRTTYYAYYAVLEGAVGALLVWWAFRRIPNTRARYVAIIVLLALLLNPFLGLNYNGLRRLLPVIAIATLAVGRNSGRLRIVSAMVASFTLAYAHEMGTAAVAGAGAVFAVELLRADQSTRALVVRDGLLYLAVAVVSWLGFIALALGSGIDDYLRELASLVPRFAAGEAGLTFSWTLNAVALFALLSLGLVLVGAGIGRRSRIPLAPGDRFVIASVAVAIVALKSGLTRADMYHLDTSIVALGMAFLFPVNVRVVAMPPRVRQLGVLCMVTIAATYAFGNLPTVSMVARGWVQGGRDVLSGREPSAPPFDPAAPSILVASTARNPALVGLASYVAEPERRGEPVLFYGRLWAIGPIIGVYKRDHLNDDFIYSDARGEREREFMDANPDALVLMNVPAYERLWGIRPDSVFDRAEYGMPPSLVKRIAARLSSVHYDAAPLESRLHALRWRRTVGDYVRAHYDSVAAFGSIIVLQRAMVASSAPR